MADQWASYSQLSTHRSCPRKWWYGYHRKLESIERVDLKVEMLFGSWWQALRCAHSLERGLTAKSLRIPVTSIATLDDWEKLPAAPTAVERVFDSVERWWASRPGDVQDTWAERLGEALPQRLFTANDLWEDAWKDDIPNEEVLALELKWTRDLPPSKIGGDVSTSLIGYVDEVYFDHKRNLVVARDNKAHKALGSQTSADDMMDSQLMIYAWGANQTVIEWGLKGIQATAYDRIRSKAPATPQVTLAGSLSKSVTDYDLATYVKWAAGPDGAGVPYPGRKKDGSDAGLYAAEPAIIERLESPSSRSAWAQRTLVPLNTHVVKAHLQASVDTAIDMTKTKARIVDGEPGRNLTSACRWCDFASLCRAEMLGGVEGSYSLIEHSLRKKV